MMQSGNNGLGAKKAIFGCDSSFSCSFSFFLFVVTGVVLCFIFLPEVFFILFFLTYLTSLDHV